MDVACQNAFKDEENEESLSFENYLKETIYRLLELELDKKELTCFEPYSESKLLDGVEAEKGDSCYAFRCHSSVEVSEEEDEESAHEISYESSVDGDEEDGELVSGDIQKVGAEIVEEVLLSVGDDQLLVDELCSKKDQLLNQYDIIADLYKKPLSQILSQNEADDKNFIHSEQIISDEIKEEGEVSSTVENKSSQLSEDDNENNKEDKINNVPTKNEPAPDLKCEILENSVIASENNELKKEGSEENEILKTEKDKNENYGEIASEEFLSKSIYENGESECEKVKTLETEKDQIGCEDEKFLGENSEESESLNREKEETCQLRYEEYFRENSEENKNLKTEKDEIDQFTHEKSFGENTKENKLLKTEQEEIDQLNEESFDENSKVNKNLNAEKDGIGQLLNEEYPVENSEECENFRIESDEIRQQFYEESFIKDSEEIKNFKTENDETVQSMYEESLEENKSLETVNNVVIDQLILEAENSEGNGSFKTEQNGIDQLAYEKSFEENSKEKENLVTEQEEIEQLTYEKSFGENSEENENMKTKKDENNKLILQETLAGIENITNEIDDEIDQFLYQESLTENNEENESFKTEEDKNEQIKNEEFKENENSKTEINENQQINHDNHEESIVKLKQSVAESCEEIESMKIEDDKNDEEFLIRNINENENFKTEKCEDENEQENQDQIAYEDPLVIKSDEEIKNDNESDIVAIIENRIESLENENEESSTKVLTQDLSHIDENDAKILQIDTQLEQSDEKQFGDESESKNTCENLNADMDENYLPTYEESTNPLSLQRIEDHLLVSEKEDASPSIYEPDNYEDHGSEIKNESILLTLKCDFNEVSNISHEDGSENENEEEKCVDSLISTNNWTLVTSTGVNLQNEELLRQNESSEADVPAPKTKIYTLTYADKDDETDLGGTEISQDIEISGSNVLPDVLYSLKEDKIIVEDLCYKSDDSTHSNNAQTMNLDTKNEEEVDIKTTEPSQNELNLENRESFEGYELEKNSADEENELEALLAAFEEKAQVNKLNNENETEVEQNIYDINENIVSLNENEFSENESLSQMLESELREPDDEGYVELCSKITACHELILVSDNDNTDESCENFDEDILTSNFDAHLTVEHELKTLENELNEEEKALEVVEQNISTVEFLSESHDNCIEEIIHEQITENETHDQLLEEIIQDPFEREIDNNANKKDEEIEINEKLLIDGAEAELDNECCYLTSPTLIESESYIEEIKEENISVLDDNCKVSESTFKLNEISSDILPDVFSKLKDDQLLVEELCSKTDELLSQYEILADLYKNPLLLSTSNETNEVPSVDELNFIGESVELFTPLEEVEKEDVFEINSTTLETKSIEEMNEDNLNELYDTNSASGDESENSSNYDNNELDAFLETFEKEVEVEVDELLNYEPNDAVEESVETTTPLKELEREKNFENNNMTFEIKSIEKVNENNLNELYDTNSVSEAESQNSSSYDSKELDVFLETFEKEVEAEVDELLNYEPFEESDEIIDKTHSPQDISPSKTWDDEEFFATTSPCDTQNSETEEHESSEDDEKISLVISSLNLSPVPNYETKSLEVEIKEEIEEDLNSSSISNDDWNSLAAIGLIASDDEILENKENFESTQNEPLGPKNTIYELLETEYIPLGKSYCVEIFDDKDRDGDEFKISETETEDEQLEIQSGLEISSLVHDTVHNDGDFLEVEENETVPESNDEAQSESEYSDSDSGDENDAMGAVKIDESEKLSAGASSGRAFGGVRRALNRIIVNPLRRLFSKSR